ncbi:CPBP family intramembrane glutamic endopeptidase [Paraclostridium sordellii]|uniref:CAAX amino terminal protease self-immunity n=1 Tax=Paraclostridium sordellii TaxID=1505 RepID=A0A0C7G4V1_PARSO|nr:CPBP family intramembrane glutamic endopeptidase [Paeniclostridium sordellii]CEN78343.1 CAAX amino terminal protease self-immunity [[Clostridium] sordellii] [Paeniclostridium sordellii]CEQ03433.1 CAAX amino terminal protease self-immunity [[Clostridium] sordellii] [Paeniclostridium sordellii]
MEIRGNPKYYKTILIGIIYMVYFYTFCTFMYQNGWFISVKDVSLSNLGTALLGDIGSMLMFSLILILVYRKNLNELGITKSKLSMVLLLIYALFFILHGDYTVNGVYRAFFYLFVIALSEEIIYRGYIYNNLKKHNRVSAIIISGILFGIMHSILPSVLAESSVLVMIKDMFNQLGGGILSGYIFILYLEKSNSIFVPILIHALLDYSYGILGIVISIIVLAYLLITSKRKEESKTTSKYLVEEVNLVEDNSKN